MTLPEDFSFEITGADWDGLVVRAHNEADAEEAWNLQNFFNRAMEGMVLRWRQRGRSPDWFQVVDPIFARQDYTFTFHDWRDSGLSGTRATPDGIAELSAETVAPDTDPEITPQRKKQTFEEFMEMATELIEENTRGRR